MVSSMDWYSASKPWVRSGGKGNPRIRAMWPVGLCWLAKIDDSLHLPALVSRLEGEKLEKELRELMPDAGA